MTRLRELGIEDKTYVIFFSDHGEMLGSHGLERKVNPYEESIRVPFIVGAWGNYKGPMGVELPLPVNHVDVGPTSLGLANIAVPEHMQGFDYSPFISPAHAKNATSAPDSVYLQSVVATPHRHLPERPWRGIVTNDGWKYVCMPDQHWLLFDLNDDPFEIANLAHVNGHLEKRAELLARTKQWADELNDSFDFPAD